MRRVLGHNLHWSAATCGFYYKLCGSFPDFFFVFREPVVHMCNAMRPSVYEDIYNKPAMVFFIYLFFLLLFARWFIFDCQPYVLLPGAGELLVHLQRNATINPCRLGERRVAAWVFSSCVRLYGSWCLASARALARVQSYKLAHTDINYATDSIHATCVCVYTNIL